MDKETLSNYGWIVICVLVLAVMIALAGPFGTFVAGAVKSTTAGLFGVNQNALGAAGITIDDQAFADCEHLETEIRNATADYSGDTCCKACGAILGTGTHKVPEGGIYYVGVTYNEVGRYQGATAVYRPGDELPETVTFGDVYVYGDYEYRFQQYCNGTWKSDVDIAGWGVRVIDDTKTNYGEILSSINGQPVTSLRGTFQNCKALETAPVLPTAGNITDMYNTFLWCESLAVAPTIPNGVTNMACTFYGCKKLIATPDIPDTVTSLRATFRNCTSLTKINKLPSNKTDMTNAFSYCTSLVDLSEVIIPNGIYDMQRTFMGCTSLTTAPAIPSSVITLYETFKDCTALTGTITINTDNISSNGWCYDSDDDNSCYRCFYGIDMSNITLTGSASKDVLNLIGATGNNWTPIS